MTTLGPGPAIAIWVQGCGIGCVECTSPETWARDVGASAEVADVAQWMNSTSQRYLTISGGEPFDQAPALAALIDEVRQEKDWVVTCYSGYYRGALERDDHPGSAALLERLDLLIDGRYMAERHAPLLWRGSANQRLHVLSERIELPPDVPAGVAVEFGAGGTFELIGVPPVRSLRADFESRLPEGMTPIAHGPFPFPTKEMGSRPSTS